MNKGMIYAIILLAFFLLPLAAYSQSEIYKVVDADGNVTFTDQPPSTDAKPMDLPPLSVIETGPQAQEPASDAMAGEPKPPTLRELRRQFRDFRITQPQAEETFWGTANSVVVTWGSSEEMAPDMSVVLYVNGEAQQGAVGGAVTLTLDRGEHQVYAILRDGQNRRIATSETVTFFIKQHSANFRRSSVGP